jgi:ElaB/YqjD/DUF883 family membrane-anchored ribosome-binding protein
MRETRRNEMHEDIPIGDQLAQRQSKAFLGMVDQATSRAREALSGAKGAVVDNVTSQSEHALKTARDYVYVVAVSSLALGFVIGMLVHMSGSRSHLPNPKNWMSRS